MARWQDGSPHRLAWESLIAADFFVLRTPLLPTDHLLTWAARLETPALAASTEIDALEEALTRDRLRLREWLRAMIDRPDVREALFVASPTLEENLSEWLAAPDSKRGLKVEKALVRYVVRMASRATPHGLAAGYSLGAVGPPTRLQLAPACDYSRRTRLEMNHLSRLMDGVRGWPELRAEMRWRPNDSLYRFAGALRYFEARSSPSGEGRSYHLVALRSSPCIDRVLVRAHRGARRDELVAEVLASAADLTWSDSSEFVDQLIDCQVLVSDLEPPVTGEDPMCQLIDALAATGGGGALARSLDSVHFQLAEMDACGIGIASSAYRQIAASMDAWPAKANVAQLFHVDLRKPALAATLDLSVVGEVKRGIGLLHRICPAGDDPMEEFVARFEQRYETREVALLEVLDEEVGIGFGPEQSAATPLLGDLPLSAGAGGPRSRVHPHLLRLLQEACRQGRPEIELGEPDLRALENPSPRPLVTAMAASGEIAARSAEEAAAGKFSFFLHGVLGPSGGKLLARFGQGDEALRERLGQMLRAEELAQPGVLHAEVVHLPQARTGNVVSRPVLREYEIPLLARSGAGQCRQIPLGDLRVSVVDGRVILRSARLDQVVQPHLTTAHNHAAVANLPAYRFLCALETQGQQGALGWTWGALAGAPFLPRVRSGRLVLALATWNIPGRMFREAARSETPAARLRCVRRIRADLRLPRQVVLVDGDNKLMVDLENELSVVSFLPLVKEDDLVALTEMFPAAGEDSVVHSAEGCFRHEILLPLRSPPPPSTRRAQPRPSRVVVPERRRFPPGSEWLYLKAYCGQSTADEVLRRLAPVIRALGDEGPTFERWFFIRYRDPASHLRLRFQGRGPASPSSFMPALLAALHQLVEEGLVWRLQLDTYEREVERYGGPLGVRLAERWFQADSEATLALLERLRGDGGEEARWRLALQGTDLLLGVMGFDGSARLRLVEARRDAYMRELGVGAAFARRLGDRFRGERLALEKLLAPELRDDTELASCLPVFSELRGRLQPLAIELRAMERDGRLGVPLASMADSFLHMHANRLLREDQRAQELVICDFLARLYQARVARAPRPVGEEALACP